MFICHKNKIALYSYHLDIFFIKNKQYYFIQIQTFRPQIHIQIYESDSDSDFTLLQKLVLPTTKSVRKSV